MAGLGITEKWICQRVKLNHDHLEDVRSLSLPGAYHEKINNIGSGLFGFTRVKHLDLARNAIVTLDGLAHLKMLEKLNLYYNRIASLDELYKLRHNTNLQELDLRLNPVTKTEPDYRLFVVHMLPNLRRLDDRSVRDSERRAALTHFSTDVASKMALKSSPQESNKPSPERTSVPRANLVKSLGRSPRQENDDDLLDLVARTTGDLRRRRTVPKSPTRKPTADDYTREEIKVLDELDEQQNHLRLRKIDTSPRHINGISKPESSLINSYETIPDKKEWTRGRNRVKFTDDADITNVAEESIDRNDSSLRFKDETEAYSKYISKGHFTPAPKVSKPSSNMASIQLSSIDQYQQKDREISTNHSHLDDQAKVPRSNLSHHEDQQAIPKEAVEKLLNLVDRYWNGSKSLHNNSKFQGYFHGVLSNYIKTPSVTLQENEQLKARLDRYANEISSLETCLRNNADEIESYRNRMGKQEEIKEMLEAADRDMNLLRSQYKQLEEENNTLKNQFIEADSLRQHQEEYQSRIDEIRKENQNLKQDLAMSKREFSQINIINSKLQTLTEMLQESHGALVATNQHLLKELEETKERHQHEVEQLHWTYEQLRKTHSLSDGTP